MLWILDRKVSRKQRSFLFMHLGSFGSCVTLRTDYDFVMIVLCFWVVFDILGFFCCFPDLLVLNFSWGLTVLWHISPPSCIHFLLMMVLWWSFCFWNVIIFLIGFFSLFFSFVFFPDLLVLNFGLGCTPFLCPNSAPSYAPGFYFLNDALPFGEVNWRLVVWSFNTLLCAS